MAYRPNLPGLFDNSPYETVLGQERGELSNQMLGLQNIRLLQQLKEWKDEKELREKERQYKIDTIEEYKSQAPIRAAQAQREFIAGELSGIADATTYQTARQRILDIMPDAAPFVPETYDPYRVEEFVKGTREFRQKIGLLDEASAAKEYLMGIEHKYNKEIEGIKFANDAFLERIKATYKGLDLSEGFWGTDRSLENTQAETDIIVKNIKFDGEDSVAKQQIAHAVHRKTEENIQTIRLAFEAGQIPADQLPGALAKARRHAQLDVLKRIVPTKSKLMDSDPGLRWSLLDANDRRVTQWKLDMINEHKRILSDEWDSSYNGKEWTDLSEEEQEMYAISSWESGLTTLGPRQHSLLRAPSGARSGMWYDQTGLARPPQPQDSSRAQEFNRAITNRMMEEVR